MYPLMQQEMNPDDIDLESLMEDLRIWELEQSRFAEH